LVSKDIYYAKNVIITKKSPNKNNLKGDTTQKIMKTLNDEQRISHYPNDIKDIRKIVLEKINTSIAARSIRFFKKGSKNAY